MTATAKFVANVDHDLIDSLARTIDHTLAPVVPPEGGVALVDFPRSANVGDSMIWLGTLAWLARSGHGAPRYVCSDLTYDPRALARRLGDGDGTILIGAGGNFGDLYPDHQEFREHVISDFPGHRIVQLPQSIHFGTPSALARAREVVARHPRLTLVVRDRPSLDLARAEFPVPSLLCPDLALGLGVLARPVPPTRRVVWLSRGDKESRADPVPPPAPGIDHVDWVADEGHPLIFLNLKIDRWLRHHAGLRPWVQGFLPATFERAAHLRLARGIRTLSAGRVVVTDRLHGHVLSLLLGIPHFVVDNTNGKVRALHEAWTRGSKLTRFCDTAAEALELSLRERGEEDALTGFGVDPLRSPS